MNKRYKELQVAGARQNLPNDKGTQQYLDQSDNTPSLIRVFPTDDPAEEGSVSSNKTHNEEYG